MPILEGWSSGEIDVVIIGAGAAGIAAARHLMVHPALSVLVVEAGRRIGGRAFTSMDAGPGIPLDLGCAWLHGARTNRWTAIAPEAGFTIDRTPAPWNQDEGMLQLGPDDLSNYAATSEAFYEQVETRSISEPDCAMGALIAPGERWHPLLDAISTFVSGAELERVSCRDHEAYQPGEGPDWRVVEGYGALVCAYGAPVRIMLDTAAIRIDHTGADRIRIETTRGPLLARAVVTTVSTDVLAAPAIEFLPALTDKLAAAAKLPLGLANKLYLRLGQPGTIAPETYRLGSAHRAATGAYHLRPFGRPVIEAFYGGSLARDLEAGGTGGFVDFATEELVGLFGSGIKADLSPLRSTAWAGEEFIRGSYSYAVPGAAGCRATLAAPVDDRLFFAGEACSPHKSTTAHGAFESGVTAADAVLDALGRRGAKATGA